MNPIARSLSTALLLVISLIAAAAAQTAGRPAETILKDLDAVEMPKLEQAKIRDQAYVRDYIKKQQEAATKRGALILELYKSAPDHERIPKLMVERWRSVRPTDSRINDVLKEIDDVCSHAKDAKFKLEAAFSRAQLKLAKSRMSGSPDLSGVEDFVKLAAGDPRAAMLLYSASHSVTDKKVKASLEDRILKDYPDSRYVGMIKGSRRQNEAVGKPFDLEFTDAIKGSTVSMKGLKGKVVVIDFWATWCGPCVAEMPKMKDLYAKYRDQGVEFIGVSLDQPKENGGLDKLKKFVADKEIAWPQYYQGKGWESEFSVSWGINAIPCVFIVDTEGNLYSVEARGKLEQMIPELLKKKNSPAGAVGGGE